HPRVHLRDPMCPLCAEAEPEPRSDLAVKSRYQGVVARAAFVDPPLRRECVEIADEPGPVHCVAGGLDPDVRSPPLIVLSRREEEPDHLPLPEPDRARRVFPRPPRRHLPPSRG